VDKTMRGRFNALNTERMTNRCTKTAIWWSVSSIGSNSLAVSMRYEKLARIFVSLLTLVCAYIWLA